MAEGQFLQFARPDLLDGIEAPTEADVAAMRAARVGCWVNWKRW